ncbi:MAG: VanZ family protein [Candidatus Omnitrophota bacterium]
MTIRRAYSVKPWMPVFIWVAAMFLVSSLPGKNVPEAEVPYIDKIAHFTEFAILGLLVMRAIFKSSTNINLAKSIILSIIIISLYAVFDEWHQGFIPGRMCDMFDFLADAAGSAAGVIIYSIWRKNADSKTV